MCSDVVLARQKKIDGLYYMVKEPGVDEELLPYMMFRNSDKVPIVKFVEWAKQRCFPPERVDAAKLLEEMGLDHYDRWEIIKQTNARLTCHDEFWVDFEN
jgi:hypothetical protein